MPRHTSILPTAATVDANEVTMTVTFTDISGDTYDVVLPPEKAAALIDTMADRIDRFPDE